MTTELVSSEPARLATQPPPRLDRIAAWVLLAGLLVMYAAAIAVGERETDLPHLREAIASGEVTEVRLSEGLDDSSRGYVGVQIAWEQHGISYSTTITQASGERQARQARSGNASTPVAVGDVADFLTTDGQQVRVAGATDPPYGTSTEVLGFTVPGGFFVAQLVITCATLLLIGAREPWRATRWAWAWLVLLTPIGVPAFLVLGGSTGLLRPRKPHRRLTAGWAFLLALLIFTPGS
ncbi:hypothetical protein [uncultured Nocardioides sp.]|uniref:hypothetical protein n=1 Tax=uncultured Nocardioides sp. TaxID=198441 RepID=UPI0026198240|nr:hypothetical protein [uncultured Nocardioides sp.]